MNKLPKELQLEIISYLGKDFRNLNLVSKYYRSILNQCQIFIPFYGGCIDCSVTILTIYVLFGNINMNKIIKESENITNKYIVNKKTDYYKFLFNDNIKIKKGFNIDFIENIPQSWYSLLIKNNINIKILIGNLNENIYEYNILHDFPYKLKYEFKYLKELYKDYLDFYHNQYGKGKGQTGPDFIENFQLI